MRLRHLPAAFGRPLLLLGVLGALAVTAPAWAHTGGSPEVQVWVDPNLSLDGVEVDVATRQVAAVRLRSVDGSTVTLLDEEGRGIVRVRGDGVEGNLAAARWYTGNDPHGLITAPADLPAEDRWVRVSDQAVWEQYDHRLHPEPLTPTLDVAQAGEGATLGTLRLPLDVDGERIDVEVTTVFRPSAGIYRTRVAEDSSQPAGAVLAAVDGMMPRLVLTTEPGATPVVLGASGEPMVRVAADGTVEANAASPTWREVVRLTDGLVPEGLPGADPDWQEVGVGGQIEWLDPRIDPAPAEPTDPADWLAEDNEVMAATVEVMADGTTTPVDLEVVWTKFGDPGAFLVNPDTDAGAPQWVRPTAVAVALLAAVLLIARPSRRRRGPTDT